MSIFDKFKKNKKTEKVFPPVPDWKPDIPQPLELIIEEIKCYTDNKNDIAIFRNGTCVILKDNLSDQEAHQFAKDAVSQIYNSHPDMNPSPMNDGNILVQYNHPAVNIVLESHASKHWEQIDQNHQRALATDEVLITPLGNNVFDELGKKALFGRCFMFMDAQAPEVIKIIRKAI
ncbi:MAG: hypothetical protein JKY67_15210 [Pseudomonadales bacterium]|nr:hypothetical protein [Pseudomonadales bacterium]